MLNVLIVDDHPLIRRGLVDVFNEALDIVAVAALEDGETALAYLHTPEGNTVDVVTLDLSLPGLSGLDVLARITTEHPLLPVLVVTAHAPEAYATRVLDLGARGFVSKEASSVDLVRAVRALARGRRFLGPLAAAARIDAETLSTREMQVVRGIADGMRQDEIAELLSVAPATVSTYRRRALSKLHLRTDADLARYAVAQGITV